MANELLRKKIREKRKAHRYTQKYLADMVGVTGNTMYTFELGQNLPTFKYIFKITKVLGLNLFIKPTRINKKQKYLIPNFSDLGEVIKNRRKEFKLSQARLSRISNITNGTMYRIEKGVASPTLGTLNKILYNLQMELDVEDIPNFSNNSKYK